MTLPGELDAAVVGGPANSTEDIGTAIKAEARAILEDYVARLRREDKSVERNSYPTTCPTFFGPVINEALAPDLAFDLVFRLVNVHGDAGKGRCDMLSISITIRVLSTRPTIIIDSASSADLPNPGGAQIFTIPGVAVRNAASSLCDYRLSWLICSSVWLAVMIIMQARPTNAMLNLLSAAIANADPSEDSYLPFIILLEWPT